MASHPKQSSLVMGSGRFSCVLTLACSLVFLAGTSYADIASNTFQAAQPDLGAAVVPVESSSGTLTDDTSGDSATSGASVALAAAPASEASPFDARLLDNHLFGGQACPLSSEPKGDTALPDGPQVKELPAPPGSMTIALSSLLTLGGFRLVRQVKQINLGSLPEWYHTDAGQVGHATPFDLDVQINTLPACWYEPASIIDVSDQPSLFDRQPERCSRWSSQYFIPTTAPRGPPSRCSSF